MSETINANQHQNTPSSTDLDAAIAADEAARLSDEPIHTDDPSETAPEAAADADAVVTKPPADEVEATEEPGEDEFEKRISRLAFEKRRAEKQVKELQARADRLEGKAPPLEQDAEIERLVEQRAAALADEQAYNTKANDIYRQGVEAFPDFDQKLSAFRELGGLSRELVEAADEAGDAHKLIHWLGRNPDEAERIMKMVPHRMGAALAKVNAKINAPKPVTKAPAPIKPVSGSVKAAEPSMEEMPIDEWMRREDERMAKKRFGRF